MFLFSFPHCPLEPGPRAPYPKLIVGPSIHPSASPSNCLSHLILFTSSSPLPPAQEGHRSLLVLVSLFFSTRVSAHVCQINILKYLGWFVCLQKSSLPGVIKWQEIKDSFVSFPRSSQRAGLHLTYLTSFANIPASIPVSAFRVQAPLLLGTATCLSLSSRFPSTALLWVGWPTTQASPGSTLLLPVPTGHMANCNSVFLDLHLQPARAQDFISTHLKYAQRGFLLSVVFIGVCPPYWQEGAILNHEDSARHRGQ